MRTAVVGLALMSINPVSGHAQDLSFVYPEEMTCNDLLLTNWKDTQQAIKGMLAFQWAAGYFAASQHLPQDRSHFEALLTAMNGKIASYCKSNTSASIFAAVQALSPSQGAKPTTSSEKGDQKEVVMGRDGRPIVLYNDGAWSFANEEGSQENKIIIRITEAKAHFNTTNNTDKFGVISYRYYFGCTYTAEAINTTKYKFNFYAFTLNSELSNADHKDTFSNDSATFHVMGGGLIEPGGRLSVGNATLWYKIPSDQIIDDTAISKFKGKYGCAAQQAAGLYATSSFGWKIGIFDPNANIKEEHVGSFMGTTQGVVAVKSKFTQ